MCNCIEEIENKVLHHVTENKTYSKPAISVRMKGKIIQLSDSLELKLSSEFEIELDGQKKKPTMPVTWTHCAFCGEKITP